MQNDVIKAKIIELVPDIHWRECAKCEARLSYETKGYHNNCGGFLGGTNSGFRPIILADVLRAMPQTLEVASHSAGALYFYPDGDHHPRKWSGLNWNLTTDYDSQTQEVKDFIGKLLGL